MRKQNLTKQERAILKQIGSTISRDIRKTGATDQEFSARAGVARSTIREVVRGASNVRVGTLRKIVTSLGYPTLATFLATYAISL